MVKVKDKTTGKFKAYIPIKECATCGKSFKGRMSAQKFCNQKCMGKKYKTLFSQKVIVSCNFCQKPVAFSPSAKKLSKNMFCNSKCYGNWMEENEIMTGEKNPTWQGGLSKVNHRIRHSAKYIRWRKSVFQRDNYTCQHCNARNGNGKTVILHADHIKPFAYFVELRFELSNGRTLCKPCHKKTDSYMKKLSIDNIKKLYG